MRSFLLPVSLILLAAVASGQSAVDTTQAQTMVKFLGECHAGNASEQSIEQIMSLPGTELIVAQQNISRRITSAQYRVVLSAACNGEIAQIQPFDTGARAQKSVQGLTADVAPSLLWGRDRVPFLEQRLEMARANRGFSEIVPMASQNLPERCVFLQSYTS
jgi:hypothetical protein